MDSKVNKIGTGQDNAAVNWLIYSQTVLSLLWIELRVAWNLGWQLSCYG